MKNQIITIICFLSFLNLNTEAQVTPVSPVCTNPPKVVTTKKVTEGYNPPNVPPTLTPPVIPPKGPGDRLIFWVHGLGGSFESWDQASAATQAGASNHPDFKARKAECITPTYSELHLESAGVSLHNIIRPEIVRNRENGTDPLNNFIIAHSQGGIVSREADMLLGTNKLNEADRMFGGVVTFGTPHQGAQLLNNLDFDGADMGTKFATFTCQSLSEGPIEELGDDIVNGLPGVIEIFNGRQKVYKILHQLNGILINDVCPMLANVGVQIGFNDYTAGITNDYYVDAPGINLLNAYQSSMHKVGFYGVEDEPVLWRTMHSLTGKEPNDYNYFDANEDEELIRTVNKAQSEYEAKVADWGVKARLRLNTYNRCRRWFPHQLCDHLYDGYQRALTVQNAYRKGVTWFFTANNRYKEIIGAIDRQVTTQLFCECEHRVTGETTRSPIVDPLECPSRQGFYLCLTSEENTVTLVEKPSDGVVLAESAGSYPGSFYNVPLLGSNHQQMRNDQNTKRALLELYGGGYGLFFVTIER